jgi:hypothetical protein
MTTSEAADPLDGRVPGDDPDVDEPPRFTLRHLRADATACARRIVKEMHQRKDTRRNRSSTRGFELDARIVGDAIVAHAELRVATASDFVVPRDLTPEEQRVHRAAALGYVTVFDEPFVVEPLPDEWESVDPTTGRRWVGRVPLTGRDADGVARVRHLLGGNRPAEIDDATRSLLALRTDGWSEVVLVDVAAPLAADRRAPLVIDDDTRVTARDWADERSQRWVDLGPDPRPRVGRDCLGCAYVASCSAHRG